VKQVCQIVRTTIRNSKTTSETQYAITSVDRDQSDVNDLLKWWRGHWGIENKVHWIRDVTFGEDRCRVRTGSAPQILAGIRNMIINWFRARKVNNFAAELRQNAWNPQRFFTILGKQNN